MVLHGKPNTVTNYGKKNLDAETNRIHVRDVSNGVILSPSTMKCSTEEPTP